MKSNWCLHSGSEWRELPAAFPHKVNSARKLFKGSVTGRFGKTRAHQRSPSLNAEREGREGGKEEKEKREEEKADEAERSEQERRAEEESEEERNGEVTIILSKIF